MDYFKHIANNFVTIITYDDNKEIIYNESPERNKEKKEEYTHQDAFNDILINKISKVNPYKYQNIPRKNEETAINDLLNAYYCTSKGCIVVMRVDTKSITDKADDLDPTFFIFLPSKPSEQKIKTIKQINKELEENFKVLNTMYLLTNEDKTINSSPDEFFCDVTINEIEEMNLKETKTTHNR